ncbi:MAG: hypothetical protein AB8V03_06180 [Francisella endosymbiont of Hyalomma asiaticum]
MDASFRNVEQVIALVGVMP